MSLIADCTLGLIIVLGHLVMIGLGARRKAAMSLRPLVSIQ